MEGKRLCKATKKTQRQPKPNFVALPPAILLVGYHAIRLDRDMAFSVLSRMWICLIRSILRTLREPTTDQGQIIVSLRLQFRRIVKEFCF